MLQHGLTGFIAAWPSPQIEASVMTLVSARGGSRPRRPLHDLDRLLGADPARRALAAALVLEEFEEIERDRAHAVLVGKNDDGVAATKAAICSSVPKSSGRSAIVAGRIPPRRRPGGTLEGVALEHAAAILVDQLAYGDAGGSQLHARP